MRTAVQSVQFCDVNEALYRCVGDAVYSLRAYLRDGWTEQTWEADSSAPWATQSCYPSATIFSRAEKRKLLYRYPATFFFVFFFSLDVTVLLNLVINRFV